MNSSFKNQHNKQAQKAFAKSAALLQECTSDISTGVSLNICNRYFRKCAVETGTNPCNMFSINNEGKNRFANNTCKLTLKNTIPQCMQQPFAKSVALF